MGRLRRQEVEGQSPLPAVMGSRFRVHPPVAICAILAGGEVHGAGADVSAGASSSPEPPQAGAAGASPPA